MQTGSRHPRAVCSTYVRSEYMCTCTYSRVYYLHSTARLWDGPGNRRHQAENSSRIFWSKACLTRGPAADPGLLNISCIPVQSYTARVHLEWSRPGYLQQFRRMVDALHVSSCSGCRPFGLVNHQASRPQAACVAMREPTAQRTDAGPSNATEHSGVREPRCQTAEGLPRRRTTASR